MPSDPADSPIDHCVAKVLELALGGLDDRRSVFQLGYNLGRLSELTGQGRGPFWDRWKEAVTSGNRPELERLARQLQSDRAGWPV